MSVPRHGFRTFVIMSATQPHSGHDMMPSVWALGGILAPALAASIIALPALAQQGRLPWGGVLAWCRAARR